MENYYQLLNIPETADEKEIKSAYRKLAKDWHPDKHQGKETLAEAETKFKAISEAYSILSDANKRKEYDRSRSMGGQFGGGKYNSGAANPFEFMQEELFTHFRRSRQKDLSKMPGESVQIQCPVSLVEALFGSSKPVSYKVRSACQVCQAVGATEFTTCSACRGAGSQTQVLGVMNVRMNCFACNGGGKMAAKACEACAGQRLKIEDRNVTVQIPPNITSGTRLRLRGVGGVGTAGMPDGDLVLEIVVQYPDTSKLTEEEKETLRALLSKQ